MTTCTQCKAPLITQEYFCSEECRTKYWGPSSNLAKRSVVWTPERVLEMGKRKIDEKKALAEQYEREWEEEQERKRKEKEEKNRPFQEAAEAFGVTLD